MTLADVAALVVDTCILAEATDVARLHHRAALDVLEFHPNLVMPAQVVREYLVATTRPVAANGLGLTLEQARANIEAFRANLHLLPEERPVLPTFWQLLDIAPCHGKRLHDAHLAATAIAHGVDQILTLNGAHFESFTSKVAVLTPNQALERLRASPVR